jgi:uncharacterized protein (DUF1330 family)
MGLFVADEGLYAQYRAAMAPFLKRHGGSFRYDFKIAETLQSESSNPINRVFIISFPTKADNDAFLSDPDYQKVREKFYKPAVTYSTPLAVYEI